MMFAAHSLAAASALTPTLPESILLWTISAAPSGPEKQGYLWASGGLS
jgi:hypothetical protein